MSWLVLVSYTLVGFVLLSWVAWPLVLRIASLCVRRRLPDPLQELPSVCVVIAAHNESMVIKEKVSNTLSLDYPADRLRVLVVSDGSTDGTDSILRALRSERVHAHILSEQGGKSRALNAARAMVQSELVLFTDANSMLDPSALKILASHFADPDVGAVSGELRYVRDGQEAATGGGLYWRYDTAIKKAEGAFGCLIGAVGPIFLLRRSLWRELDPLEVPDLALGLAALEEGQRSLYDPRATCTEVVAESTAHEKSRYRRIVSRSIPTALRSFFGLVSRGRALAALLLFAHKIVRYFTVPLLAASLVFAAPALPAAGCVVILGTAAAALAAAAAGAKLRPLRLAHYFVTVQLSAGLGVVDWIFGRNKPTWTVPVRSSTGGAAMSAERSMTRSKE